MQLKLKINLFTLTMLILLTALIVFVGTYIINDIVYGLNKRLLSQEMNHLSGSVENAYNILLRTGIHTIETYVTRKQKQLAAQFKDHTFGRTGHIYIVDNRRRAILHNDYKTGATVDLPFIDAMLKRKSGFIEYQYQGLQRFCVFRTFPQWNWLMALSVAKKEMFEKRAVYLIDVSVIAFLILMINIFVMGFFVKKITDRLHKTLECTNQIKQGNLQARIDRTSVNDEIGELQHNINAMAIEIERRIADQHQAEKALRKSEEQYRALFENAPLGVVLVTYTGKHLTVNNAICQMLGYSRTELEQINPQDLYQYPDKRDEFIRRLQADGCVRGFEATLTRKDDSVFYARLTAVPAPMIGEDAILAMSEDITERKQYEQALKASLAEKEVLLKEVYHRVKNNLEIISSLLYLQSAAIEDEPTLALFKESENRVRSMGMIHEKLYQSDDLARVDYSEYIHGLVNNLMQSYAGTTRTVAFTVETQNLSLGIDTAIPCGLIINELVTNAIKYAFPEETLGPDANAEIRITMTKDDDNGYLLRVSDNGIGFHHKIDLESNESLGIRIVHTLTHQLDGTIQFENRAGTSVEIRFRIIYDAKNSYIYHKNLKSHDKLTKLKVWYA